MHNIIHGKPIYVVFFFYIIFIYIVVCALKSTHESRYAMRAIYIAKGSPLLPPTFVSIFDDLASSSLDVFFDPSRGLTNLPGFTLGNLAIFLCLSILCDGHVDVSVIIC